ncbi:phospho-sugar mutase [Labilibaculum euxinus]|uniref:Phospho-sugar mutase n=1 Tax=Labilibaculum euxinus TaxID=2686357 RepID=A0A7M4DBA6_9BACT|nr:phospho-sugar mutase [Labilibaculum euxinus]MUP39935.1 phospho-sugar mutase [Labilibaculum euxinus]MVB09140.1 phospho-sugar mutase [Labilibaculum euxinus]
MNKTEIFEIVNEKAKIWLEGNYDQETKEAVKSLLEKEDKTDLIDSFYKDLEFGTGGLRGKMGPGTNRMNIYTVGAATQGLANYINKVFAGQDNLSVCIGYDCRNNSKLYSDTVANIFSANGIKAYIFEDLRPTPEMSFAIRQLGCQSGVIITASHNPKEYNGYKAYWEDGSQLVVPHDKNVIAEVKAVKLEEIKFEGNPALIEVLGEDMDKLYLDTVKTLSLSPEAIKNQKDLKIVFTPLHGTTVKLVPASLKNYGFENVIHIPEQDVVDGNFPTVWSANPEEPEALKMAVDKAKEVNADLVMACDPDGDRLGIAATNDKGEWEIVNGNQTALIFNYYLIRRRKELGLLTGNDYVVKTIVTTELFKDVAEQNGVQCFDAYTGFKWIADVIRKNPDKNYIGGGEESFGYMPGDFTRDKDAVSSCSIMAEIAAWAKEQGKNVFDILKDIYVEYGYSKEKMIYIVREGLEGAQEIEKLMYDYRYNRPKKINGSTLILVKDYSTRIATNPVTGEETALDFETTADVLQFYLEDGTKISVRPSGTEPKIKYYFEVRENLASIEDFYATEDKANKKIQGIISSLELN